METRPILLLFFWGQLLWDLISAETMGPANSLPPMGLPITRTEIGDMRIRPPTPSTQAAKLEDPIKDNRELSTTASPLPPTTKLPPSHDGHLIAAVLIGVTLVAMIGVIVGIFLWRRWRKPVSPDPHWAGRSPFADGDMSDVATDKEHAQAPKRMSVLSVLPWRFNKETELLGNAEGPLSESQQNLGVPPPCGSQGTGSSPTLTGNSDTSASMQTSISEDPGGLIDIPLQADTPEPLDLPPPPNWFGNINGELSLNQKESISCEQIVEAQSLDSSYQVPGEILQLTPPPPPEDFLVN